MRGWSSRAIAAGVLSNLALASASAADETKPPPKPHAVVFFGSFDASTLSGFGSLGFKTALSLRLDDPGWFVMASAGAGMYQYRGGARAGDVTGRPSQASALIGHQWIFGRTIVGLFVGPEYRDLTLGSVDFSNRERGGRFGLRGQAEIWSHPTDATLLTGTVVAGATGHVWARLAAGVKIERVYVGPEITAYADATYNETRLGAHVTGVAVGPVTFRLSGGFVFTGDGETGAYAGLSGYVKY